MQRTNLYRALTRARTRSLAARMSTSHLKSLAETALRLNILEAFTKLWAGRPGVVTIQCVTNWVTQLCCGMHREHGIAHCKLNQHSHRQCHISVTLKGRRLMATSSDIGQERDVCNPNATTTNTAPRPWPENSSLASQSSSLVFFSCAGMVHHHASLTINMLGMRDCSTALAQ
jgi:hypothetical protein